MIAMVIVAGGGAMAMMVGWESFPFTAMTAVVELAIAMAIAVAAGGFGYPLIARLTRSRDSSQSTRPATGLVVFTSCALGLWMLSTAMLILGSVGGAMLSAWVWWAIIAAGVLLAAWQGRRHIEAWSAPRHYGPQALLWIVIAIAVGMWLAGAMRPPGTIGIGQADAYDVLEYHLQVPREYFEAGKITALAHNVYSYYPSGTEMLFLLGMCLRGGAYEGMYLATVMHGLFGAIAVAALISGLGNGERRRGRFAAVLLATSPAILYLSWLAMVELSQLMYLTLALLWLREWLAGGDPSAAARSAAQDGATGPTPLWIAHPWGRPRGPDCGLRIQMRSAACIGLMLGAACSVKYLSVGFIAVPVLAVMLATALWPLRSRHLRVSLLWHAAIAGVMTLLLLSPWLIRDAIATGNPVFPLATNIFGPGYLPVQEEQRWFAGHSPNNPPVPIPPGWQEGDHPSRVHMLIENFVTDIWFGPPVVAIVIVWLIVLVVRRFVRRRGQGATPPPAVGAQVCPATKGVAAKVAATAPAGDTPSRAWDWALFGVLAIQVALWVALTRGTPWRFLSPAIAEIALLAAGALAVLVPSRTTTSDRAQPKSSLKPSGAAPKPPSRTPGAWAEIAAVALLCALAGVNLWSTYSFFRTDTGAIATLPWSGREIASQQSPYSIAAGLPKGSKIMLVGEARAFYFPPGIVYATAFDPNPLAVAINASKGDPQELLRRLRAAGVTHIWVNWAEMWRLAATYGLPPQLAGGLWPAAQAGQLPRIDALDGAKLPALKIEHFYRDPTGQLTTQPAAGTTVSAPTRWDPFAFPHGWPVITLYTIPKPD
jgi:hypothetical protein